MTFRHRDDARSKLSTETERVGKAVLDAAFKVHTDLGPGLLERVYRDALRWGLEAQGFEVEAEVRVPLRYLGREAPRAFRLDLRVEGCVLVEVKAVEKLRSVHEAQLLTYLKLTDHSLGFVLNFNVPRMTQGIRRVIHTP